MDPMRVVAFLHVVLFAYWIGTDLGVFLASLAARRPGVSADARRRLLELGVLLDMAPRTCLVLMVPTGFTLAAPYGSPVQGPALVLLWAVALAWLCLVWLVHWNHGQPLGRTLWKLDFAVRSVATAGFIGLGAWRLAAGGPMPGWLVVKILLFGLIILAGIAIRILLLVSPMTASAADDGAAPARDGQMTLIRGVVLAIWALVFVLAYLGIAKPS